ncbi:tape measure protein [Anaerotruncus rubiinfantis]|uniref:tape measure protein n=1 Tax=Anaerotruncus rubiinfantis TaxID=1720200 RepID=UPI001896E398|nr:tape measure protein [Anaerotruncus rubiinfantis]
MAGISTSFSIQDRMTRTFDRMSGANERLNRTLAATDRMTNTIDLDNVFQGVAAMIDDAANRTENLNQKQQQAESSANGIKRAWDKVRSTVQGVIAALAVNKVLDLADSMTTTRARLDLMNDGLQTTAELQDMIMASANRSRASYQATADAVSKMGIMAKDAFNSNGELVAFSELINKQFTIAGTSAAGIDAAMLQLTQAMSSGVLRGEELNSVFEQAPTIVQTIADYLDVPIGKIREMAAEGQITSTIVKNAMLSSADEINAKFASMPMTFSQVWTIAKNIALEAFTPVLTMIGQGAQWIYDNWSTIAPIFWGLAAAVGAFALITGVWTAVTWLQVAANRALLASMLTNPILWVAIVIGLVIGLIYQWIQSVGGLKVAWLMACNWIATAWDWVWIGLMTGVYWVMNLFNRLQLTFATVSTNIQNFMGDMKAGVLMILQNMVNGAIDIINGFINLLNKIPGVNIGLIEQVTFGTTAQLENEAAKQARASDLAAYQDQINSQIAERDAALGAMKSEARAATAQREAEIAAKRAEAAAEGNGSNEPDWAAYADGAGDIGNVGHVGSVGSVDEDVNIAEEDLKFLRDVAEMRYTQNLVTLTPQVVLSDVKISEKVDVDEVVSQIERKLEDEFSAAAEGVYS